MRTQTETSYLLMKLNEWAEKAPNVSCYEYRDETLTYQSLKTKSDALAYYLAENYIAGTSQPALVYGHMNSSMLVAFIAVVKSGRAYIPVDSSMPKERLEQIIEAAQPAYIIATESFPLEESRQVPLITPDDLDRAVIKNDGKALSEERGVAEDENHYIIYTSGSTGMPKGVQISHNNLVSFTNWMLKTFSFAPGRRVLNQAPFSFDLSVMDLYPTLIAGGTLVPLDKAESNDLKNLATAIQNKKLQTWVSTPSFADVCLLDPNFNGENNPELTEFLFCGEVLTKETAAELLKRFPKARVFNTYGPTEATVAVTHIEVTPEILEQYEAIPLGEPKADLTLKIMREDGSEAAAGEKGEIVLIGPSVSKGYLHEAEKTAKVFSKHGGYRAYHTGDCGYKEAGQLFYHSRMDFQVKLHGYRIELEDIEQNLKVVDYVKNAVVLPRYRAGKVEKLVAVIVPNEHDFEKDYQLTKAIKNELKEVMPSYMIPGKWLYKTELPLTMNGKIDRKLLAEEVQR